MALREPLGRRQFSQVLLGAAGSYALLRTLLARDALAGPVVPEVHAWTAELHAMSRDLASATITPRLWQTRVAALWDRVAVHDLLAAIDFDRLVQGLAYPDLGVITRLDLGAGKWDVSNIDPGAAEALGSGRLRARKLSVSEALQKYGRDPGRSAPG